MKIENVIVIILIIGSGTAIGYFAVSNWWSHIDVTTFIQKTPYYDSTNSTNDTDLAKLFLTTNSTFIKQGQTIEIDLKLVNTSNKTLIANYENNLIPNHFGLAPCDVEMPIGIKILYGNYDINNMTEGEHLLLYHGVYHCQVEYNIKRYDFEPSSDKVLFETIGGINNSFETSKHLSFTGYYDRDKFQTFASGVYTIIGSDEWKHVEIIHFRVTNSTHN